MQVPKTNSLHDHWMHRSICTSKESLIWISEAKKLLYIKTPKCASTSIAKTLISNIPDMRNLKSYNVPPNFDDYYKFTFVRNPWDRFVSLYHNYFDTNKLAKLKVPKMTFNEFVKSDVYKRIQTVKLHAMPLTEILWFNGVNQMDFVGKYENISTDWHQLKEYIDVRLPVYNSSKGRKIYKDYYTPETRNIIADLYAQDMKNFEYQFSD